MSSKNLWGDIASGGEIRTPTLVLKEQATALAEITKGTLRGKVIFSGLPGRTFEIELSIIAPAMDNYEFEVLYVKHGIEMYPATVVAAWERYERGKEVECQNEDELTDALRRILASERVKRVIASLIAQSKAMK